jgi:hypothetical protein
VFERRGWASKVRDQIRARAAIGKTPILVNQENIMSPRRRTTFDKLQKERTRKEKQEQKRARRRAKGSGDAQDPANPAATPTPSEEDLS